MKKGFTLAEVLITLGIVGVVAALTAPALVKNSGQAKIGPALAKFVNTFETACEQMMMDENVSKLSDIGDINDVLNKLSNYIVMTYVLERGKEYNISVSGENYGQNGHGWYSAVHGYVLKDGSFISTTTAGIGKTYFKSDYPANGIYKGSICSCLFYDLNGPQGKNIAGKDVFAFHLDDSGILIPLGSKTHKNLYGGTLSFDKDYVQELAHTGEIADNGWKADY